MMNVKRGNAFYTGNILLTSEFRSITVIALTLYRGGY